MLAPEASVGIGGTEEHGHPPERLALPGRIDYQADGGARLLVGVASADHTRRPGSLDTCRRGHGEARSLQGGHHGPIGFIDTGGTDEHGERSSGGQGLEEAGAARWNPLREVQDHGAEVGPPTVSQDRGGGGDQIVLVVPAPSKQIGRRPDDPHDVGGSRALGGHGLEGFGADSGQFALCGGQRQLGSGMHGNLCQPPGGVSDGGADCLKDHRSGDRAEAGICERRPTNSFSQTVEGEEARTGDAVSSGELPAVDTAA